MTSAGKPDPMEDYLQMFEYLKGTRIITAWAKANPEAAMKLATLLAQCAHPEIVIPPHDFPLY